MPSQIRSNVRGIRSLVEQKVREIRHTFHAWRSWRRGRAAGLPGAEYFKFGRAIGWKLWFQNDRLGSHLLSSPVSSTRYFEFAFAREALPDHWQLALDVSSPFLFSLDVAGRCREGSLHLMNPDAREIDVLRKVLGVRPPKVPIELFNLGVEALDKMHNTYDVIWSLSVVEHIESEQGDDRDAVKRMFAALRYGGWLVLTVPTDTSAWREYREDDPYGTQPQEVDSKGAVRYFFQRFYDARAIRDRIIDNVGVEPVKIVWYGEKEKGRFHDYIARWLALGREAVLDDPAEFATHYQIYDSWESMPGAGVCGLVFVKP